MPFPTPRTGRLDGPPPLPSSVAQASSPITAMGGGAQDGEGGSPGAATTQALMKGTMLAVRVLSHLSSIHPGLSPLIDSLQSQLRDGVVRIVQAGQQQQQVGAPGSPAQASGLVSSPAPPVG